MRKPYFILVLILVGSACAEIRSGPQHGVAHVAKLGLPPDVLHGSQIASGPLTLLQARVETKGGKGHALVWVSKDSSCPNPGVGESNDVSPENALDGPLPVAADQFLCALARDSSGDAELEWVTPTGSSGGSTAMDSRPASSAN